MKDQVKLPLLEELTLLTSKPTCGTLLDFTIQDRMRHSPMRNADIALQQSCL